MALSIEGIRIQTVHLSAPGGKGQFSGDVVIRLELSDPGGTGRRPALTYEYAFDKKDIPEAIELAKQALGVRLKEIANDLPRLTLGSELACLPPVVPKE